MYICDSLHVHISQLFMHCLHSTSVHVSDCCSICDLILVLFFISILFAYYVFSCVVFVWCLYLSPQ